MRSQASTMQRVEVIEQASSHFTTEIRGSVAEIKQTADVQTAAVAEIKQTFGNALAEILTKLGSDPTKVFQQVGSNLTPPVGSNLTPSEASRTTVVAGTHAAVVPGRVEEGQAIQTSAIGSPDTDATMQSPEKQKSA